MAAYIIATIEVTDPEKFEVYRGQVPATIEKHGGRYLARGGDVTVVEGDQPVRRTVILEFDSLEPARPTAGTTPMTTPAPRNCASPPPSPT